LLVHICCSVDSHFFLQKLTKLYPDKKLTGFFYDPNIHPYSEYKLRLMDVKRSCKKLGIDLLEGEYDYERWIEAVRGFESEPEKGKRCSICFDNRLEATAQKALELGESEITTTLLTSPKKSIEQLRQRGAQIQEQFGVHVATPDFRIDGGTQEQFALAKEEQLYHQNYCGCLFALEVQREGQDRLKDELSSPITAQILPSSIEDRINLYENIIALEEKNEKFRLKREKFLNYRLLRAFIKDQNKNVIPSYFLFYSTLLRDFVKGRVNLIENDIGYFNREEVLIVSIKKLNKLLNTTYKDVSELMKNAPSVEDEIKVRNYLSNSYIQTLNTIIVVDIVEERKYEVYLNSKTYTDVREVLVKIR